MKKIINLIESDIYTVLEFEDHTVLPLISVENFVNHLINKHVKEKVELENAFGKNECIFCHNKKDKLCTLDGKHYICLECTQRILEYFSGTGSAIDLKLRKLNPKLMEQLNKFLTGNLTPDKVVFQVKDSKQAKD